MPNKSKVILMLTLGLGALLLAGSWVSAGPGTQGTPYAGGCAYGSSGCGSGGCGGGYDTGLNNAQIQDIRREKEAFYNATRSLRNAIVEKQSALAAELAKPAPDAGRAGELQGDLSDLKSKFNQKYLQFVIAMKKIVPDYGTVPGQNRGGGAGGSALPSCCAE